VLRLTANDGTKESFDEMTAKVNEFPEIAEVVIPAGSSVPGCEETNQCYIPFNVFVNIGTSVTWFNSDSAAHTVTSGTESDGPDGLFDSSLFTTGSTFSVKFDGNDGPDVPGEYAYFCLVHPWMNGKVTVKEIMTVQAEIDTSLPPFFGLVVSITGANAMPSQNVMIKIFDPSNQEIDDLNVISTKDGGFIVKWTAPEGFVPGTYTIKAITSFEEAETTIELSE